MSQEPFLLTVTVTHCCDTIKQSKLMQDALDTTHEITKLITNSPGSEATFKSLRCETAPEIDVPGIRLLCPTRWTVRADYLNSILENYSVLVKLWSTALGHTRDTEMKSRIQGVVAQMATFNLYFGSSLALLILCQADNLSKSLQTKRHVSSRRTDCCSYDKFHSQGNAKR